MIDKRNTHHEKNAQTQRDRNTATDMDETREDGDDDDETGYSEDDHLEDEDGAASHSKLRQTRSFNLTTGGVKRMESKEDDILTATCQVNVPDQAYRLSILIHKSTLFIDQGSLSSFFWVLIDLIVELSFDNQ